MKLYEEFRLYENMWDEEPDTEAKDLSNTITMSLDKAFRRNDNILIEAPYHANAVGICKKWVADKGRSLTQISAMAEPMSELEIELKQAYSRRHIVLLEDVERLKPAALRELFTTIVEYGNTAFTICIVEKALPFSSWNSRVFPVVVHGLTNFNELTEATSNVVNKHSDDVWTVAFKDDPEHPVIAGDKAKCDAFVKNNEATLATKSHGGLVIKQGGQVPVVDESLTEAAPKKLKLATPKSSIEVPLTENTKNNYVFIDLSGGSEKFKDELTSAAVADGHKAEDMKYFDDFRFAEATKAAKQGHNVFLYTRDDDYKVNSELEKLPNVKVKMITNLSEALNDTAAKDPNFYNKVKRFVEDWLTGRGLRDYCEDSYDNSYNSGNGMHYELQWNFSEVPGLAEVQTALSQALNAISIYAGINIVGEFDAETLEDDGLINLTVSYDV